MWNQFVDTFTRNFIDGGNWHYIAEGLLNTIKITFFAVLLGIVIGLIVGTIRSTYDKTHKLKGAEFPLQHLSDCDQRNASLSAAFNYLLRYFCQCEN